MEHDESPLVDARAVRRFADRAACRPGNSTDVLAREIESRMIERLSLMRLDPKRILDAGAGRFPAFVSLHAKYPAAEMIALDFACRALAAARRERGMAERIRQWARASRLSFLCSDFEQIPLVRSSVALIWSNLSLGSHSHLKSVFDEWHRVLELGGLVMFSTYGPDTLKELRATFPTNAPRVHPFIDMHDLGDMLVAAGFADPVMDMETLTLTYRSVDQLLTEIRATGQSNARFLRRCGLHGRKGLQQALAAYERSRQDGRLPATVEIVYGHAWKTEPRNAPDGSAIIRFQPSARRRSNSAT